MAYINLDTASRLDITCRKNDSFSLDLTITDENGDALDLTSDYTFELDVRKSSRSGSTILTFTEADNNFTKTSSGGLTIKKAATDMNVAAGLYVFDLQATNSSTNPDTVQTWFAGDFEIIDDITE
jgi:hypothetical protein